MRRPTNVQTDIKPLNYKQLAAVYEVTHKTLKKWLEPFTDEIGELRGKTFTIRQIRIIYERLGEPSGAAY